MIRESGMVPTEWRDAMECWNPDDTASDSLDTEADSRDESVGCDSCGKTIPADSAFWAWDRQSESDFAFCESCMEEPDRA